MLFGMHGLYGAFLRQNQGIRPAIHAALVTLSLVAMAVFGAAPAYAADIRLLVLGDSLSAGYNLPQDASFPAQLQKALAARGIKATVINAGVSGDTTAGALSRVDWALADKPTHALVALGANDMLRGLSPEAAQANLDKILAKLTAAGVKPMLAGMLAAPNLGADYGRRFEGLYPALAAKYKAPLYPFYLDGVAAEKSLLLDDGMHPNSRGVAVMVERILPSLLPFLTGG